MVSVCCAYRLYILNLNRSLHYECFELKVTALDLMFMKIVFLKHLKYYLHMKKKKEAYMESTSQMTVFG